jgi:hypothetical protein
MNTTARTNPSSGVTPREEVARMTTTTALTNPCPGIAPLLAPQPTVPGSTTTRGPAACRSARIEPSPTVG